MNNYLVLNSWTGNDPKKAASRLAQMFRMTEVQASKIFENVLEGHVWQFPNPLSDQKAQVAKNYLKNLGFNVAGAGEESTDITASEVSEPAVDIPSSGPMDQDAVNALLKSTAGTEESQVLTGNERTVNFHGDGWGLAKIMFVNWILTVLTLGVYYFWGKTKVRRYLFDQSSFAGDRFSYHGTGGELFRGWIFFMFLVTVFVGGGVAVERHLGVEAAVIFKGSIGFIFFLLFPALLVGAYRYRLSRSAWRGIRFSFRGTRKNATLVFLKGYILTLLTLNIYLPFFQMNMQRFWSGNSHFGNQSFKFTGEGKDVFKRFLLLLLLVIPTFGLYIIWYQAYIARYNWSHTHFAGGTFRFTATGWETFKLHFINLLLLLVTVGLAYPLVTVRMRRFFANHISLMGEIDLDKVVQDIKQSGSIGEGALEAFDVPLDIV